LQLAAPGDGVDVDAERVLAEAREVAGLLDDEGEDGGPALCGWKELVEARTTLVVSMAIDFLPTLAKGSAVRA
jgi:hypothetical protein